MCDYNKRKHSCLNCLHYHHAETVSDGWISENCGGIIISSPKYKKIPHYCDHDNEKFLAWWEANKFKSSKDVEAPEECFELSDSLKPLEKMISLAEDILESIKKEKA